MAKGRAAIPHFLRETMEPKVPQVEMPTAIYMGLFTLTSLLILGGIRLKRFQYACDTHKRASKWYSAVQCVSFHGSGIVRRIKTCKGCKGLLRKKLNSLEMTDNMGNLIMSVTYFY